MGTRQTLARRTGATRRGETFRLIQGGTIFSILGSYAKVPAGKRELVTRVDCPSAEALRADLSKRFDEVAIESD